MNTTLYYTSDFFDNLTLDADRRGHTYKVMLSESVKDFLQEQSKDNAYVVYSMFFDVYRIGYKENRAFIDLLDVLRSYEENTGSFNDAQRDHYIHSVNVFLLGLSIYARNTRYREYVARWNRQSGHKMLFSTDQEEFLFTWGVSALFHDIGYPVEIISKQLQQFITYIAEDVKKEIGPYLSYLRFDKLNSIQTSNTPSRSDATFDVKCPTDLLAMDISGTLGTDCVDTKYTLDNFLSTMQRSGFVDHGFYSALIVLKWYGEILLGAEDEDVFFNQVVPAASAIYLHNAYKNVFQKNLFNCPPLNPGIAPLAYLLILCDEAQEWNRKAYGSKARAKVFVDDSALKISESSLSLHYVTSKGLLTEEFLNKKQALFEKLLDVQAVFPAGISVTATTLSEQFVREIRSSAILPRLLANNIEVLARRIHDNYNAVQLERYPELPLQHPTWDSLPDVLKYSNIRQAKAIADKLAQVGCYASAIDSSKTPYTLTEDEVEFLSRYEHDLWVEERKKTGWTIGPVKDTELKTTPYLVPYDDLTEEIKELDRDTIRNIAPLLQSVGLAVYKEGM